MVREVENLRKADNYSRLSLVTTQSNFFCFLEDESEVTKCFDFVEKFWPRMLKVVVEDSATVSGICQIMGFCETKKVLNDHS